MDIMALMSHTTAVNDRLIGKAEIVLIRVLFPTIFIWMKNGYLNLFINEITRYILASLFYHGS